MSAGATRSHSTLHLRDARLPLHCARPRPGQHFGRGVLALSGGSSVQWSDPERYRCIYGGDIGLVGYWDAHDASRGGPDVSVSDGWTITRFIFNEDDRVYKIEFWASVD